MDEFNVNELPQSDNAEENIFSEEKFTGQAENPVQKPSPNEQYRQMYSAQQPQSSPNEQYRQMYTAPQGAGYYHQAEIPPVSPSGNGMSKGARAALIAVAAVIVLLMAAVMILLAVYHADDTTADAGDILSSADSSFKQVVVNIQTQSKPVEGEEYYQDIQTGLLTPAGAAKQILPSIVNLYGYSDTTITYYSCATGIIISEDGYIVTNAHVVDDVKKVKAVLNDGRELEAKIIAYDAKTDLAVLKIEADGLTAAVIGNSSELVCGEQVVAVGNADGFNDTVTVGYVSHTDREISSYNSYPIECIQTDAALNSGNSGGAVVNLYGQVVGIVVSKSSSEGVENMGFAIKTDFAVPIIEDLMEYGFVEGRPRIGIMYRLIDPTSAQAYGVEPGLLISEISEDCDIANTELAPDDIITEMNGIKMTSSDKVLEFQQTYSAGDMVTARVYRKTITGEESEFEITFRLEQDS